MNWRCLRTFDVSALSRRRCANRLSHCKQYAPTQYVRKRIERQQINRQQINRQQIDSAQSCKASYDHRVLPSNNSTLSQNGSWLSTSHTQPTNSSVPMRLLWFRTTHTLQPKVVTLLNRFGKEGLDIQVIEISSIDKVADHALCELIMLECINAFEHEMIDQLYRVRAGSQVPVIVLTDNHTLDWSLLALREGADAIFTLNTPDDIIIARSNALLRRWATS